MALNKYSIDVEVTYKLKIPVTGKDEDDAIKELEKIIGKSDDYEIVNRSTGRATQIKEIKVTYE